MLREPFHLSDQDILLLVDGEVSPRRAKQARAHLTVCWSCRARLEELEGTIADFVSLHRHTLDPQLPAAAGSRALLKARLAEAAAMPSTRSWTHFLQLAQPQRAAAYLCVALLISVLGGKLLLQHSQAHPSAVAELTAAQIGMVPDHNLTPGAIRAVSIVEVCSMAHEEVVRDVPSSLRQQVFQEYGILHPRPEDYEIDYLIAPGLGGTEDIHNLWPEPSTAPVWNAHVKDALEERLHQLVCDGKLDLPTAQRAIATDWIGAYKKYLSTYAESDDAGGRMNPAVTDPSWE
jgi:anti-sigma factor RsiW